MAVLSNYSVSVIMPVYNAAAYVERAVESVIHLDATGELLMIDDASTDGSLAICHLLQKKYAKIRVLEHADGKNHGAAASRNLGIINSSCNFISFLDADDFYLPNRFKNEEALFQNFPEIDGVYGCTSAIYESKISTQLPGSAFVGNRTTMTSVIKPEDLFMALILGGYGYFHTSGITIKKGIFRKTGMFNENIRHVEDTELWYKFSLLAKLLAGSIDEPIAVRWVHENNSIHQIRSIKNFKIKMHGELFYWALYKPFSFEVKNLLFNAFYENARLPGMSPGSFLWEQLKRKPYLIFTLFYIKKLYVIKLY